MCLDGYAGGYRCAFLTYVFNLARRKLVRHHDPFKHFSFLLSNKTLIAQGINYGMNSRVISKYPEYSKVHSEFAVLHKAKGNTMVNIRLNSSRELRNSKPCSCCVMYMKMFGVRTVYYTTRNGWEKMKL